MDRPPRARTQSATFSLKSDKSWTSKGSKSKKEPLVETEDEKRKRELVSKANPNAAMNEIQPVAEALKAPTIGSLRDVQHVDAYGNAIAEPDLSNPTRPRWERPLDTIRSFEAAIENDYKRRSPGTRPGTAMFSDSGVGYNSRRGSYFGGDHYQAPPRFSQGASQGASQVGSNFGGGYYGRNSFVDSYAGYGQDGRDGRDGRYGPGPSSQQRRPYDRRQHSEPMLNRYNAAGGVYPSPGYQKSRDTVNTGDSHSQSEPWTNNTDPSSENSSIDQIRMAPKHDQVEQHGYNGGSFQQRPIQEEMQMGASPGRPVGYPQQQQSHGANPPPPPPHQYNENLPPAPRQGGNRLVKLSSGGQGGPPPVPSKDNPNAQSPPAQKRSSWLKRTFSKKT